MLRMVPPPWALPPACRDRGVGSADPPGYEVGRKKGLPHGQEPALDQQKSVLTITASYEGQLTLTADATIDGDRDDVVEPPAFFRASW